MSEIKITLSEYAGFCEGVDRAYSMVEQIANDPKVKKPMAVLGSLVHNSDVVKKIEKLGVKRIDLQETLEDTLKDAKGKVKTIIITAHGMGPRVYSLARKMGIELIDTTCPKVTKVQRLAKHFLGKMCQIVIIGESGHKEVKGIFEWADKKAVFIEKEDDLEKMVLDPEKKIAVLSQTTQDRDFVKRASEFIRNKYKDVQVVDSICDTTHNRQSEIENLAKEHDSVIVIGSPESSNSNRLWEIAKRVNDRTFFIERATQLRSDLIGGSRKIAVTAGASTPKWIIDEVMEYLNKNLK